MRHYLYLRRIACLLGFVLLVAQSATGLFHQWHGQAKPSDIREALVSKGQLPNQHHPGQCLICQTIGQHGNQLALATKYIGQASILATDLPTGHILSSYVFIKFLATLPRAPPLQA